MTIEKLSKLLGLAVLLSAQSTFAQDADDNAGSEDGEITIMLIADPNAQLPEAVTNYIELPMSASPEGQANNGLETANENRQRGLEIVLDAQERGREFGQDMAEAAQESVENLGRGRGLENRPDPPDPPGPPDTPGPPNPPGPPGS